MNYAVRVARVDELERLADIERNASLRFAATEYAHLSADPPLSLELLVSQQRLGAVWVALDATQTIVGFAVAGELSGIGYLFEVDVDPAHGRRGLGRALVEASLDWAIDAGYPAMALSTFVDVPWNAPFYERLGFRKIPTSSLSPSMLQIRSREVDAGLPVRRRAFMQMPLRQPN